MAQLKEQFPSHCSVGKLAVPQAALAPLLGQEGWLNSSYTENVRIYL